MINFELVGYVASALVFVSFLMKTMIPLRMVAVGSNVAFLSYGVIAELWIVVVLHSVLLPVNLFRLAQVIKAVRRISQTAPDDFSFSALIPFMKPARYRPGDLLFSKAERGAEMFYIAQGTVLLTELDIRVGPGDILGEISLFSSRSLRTATACCETDCLVYAMTEEKVRELYFQDPKFGFYIIQVIVDRLIANASVAPGHG